ncbi:MAG: HD domain-containing phosphohydrolase [Planctomycetota bacterium]
MFKQVPVSSLRTGSVLKAPIVDPTNSRIKLLSEGMEVTKAFLDRLRQRGIDSVAVSTRDLAIQNSFLPQGISVRVSPPHAYVQSLHVNDHSKAVDARVHSGEPLHVGDVKDPLLLKVVRPDHDRYEKEMTRQWASDNDRLIQGMAEFADDLLASKQPKIEPIVSICDELIRKLNEDRDAFMCLASTPFESEYPTRHAMHLAGVAIIIGLEIGLDHSRIMELGTGCLLHDIGMTEVGLEIFETKSTLNQRQLQHLADHPVHAIGIAGRFEDQLSEGTRMVIYQIHERCDRSGYPRGRSGQQIHTLAKIAAVADSYVGMLSRRRHRNGAQGHFVVKQILEEVKAGKLDPTAVRALLQATSLYPVGSYVETNNEKVGRVVRTNGANFDSPTIEMWDRDQLDRPPAIVNLTQERDIKIVRSIRVPEAA